MSKPLQLRSSPLPEVDGSPFIIRGINLGSWINIENFMIGLEGTDWQIRKALQRELGAELAEEFFGNYQRAFLNENDIRCIAGLGFNTVRLPFNWRYFETDAKPFEYRSGAFGPVDKLFDWCGKYNLKVMLDFHAAPGGQNTTPPSDNTTGYSLLWQTLHYQDRVVALWEALARRYCQHPALLGYNLLNEPQVNQHGELDESEQLAAMNSLYHRIVNALRVIDKHGLIVIEGPVRTSGGLDHLDKQLFSDKQTAVSYHHYPMAAHETGINFEPNQNDSDQYQDWYDFLAAETEKEQTYAHEVGRPMILGEFGLSADWDQRLAMNMLRAQLAVTESRGWGWLLWSYKDLRKLGLYNPAPQTPWAQFVRDKKSMAAIAACREGFARHFDGVYMRHLCKDERNTLVYDASWGDAQRGLNRILLDYQVRRLGQLPRDTIVSLAESFALENCRLREDFHAILKPFLAD